jgi:hypothetical protein
VVNAKEEITPQQRIKEQRRTSLSSANIADSARNTPIIKRQNRYFKFNIGRTY